MEQYCLSMFFLFVECLALWDPKKNIPMQLIQSIFVKKIAPRSPDFQKKKKEKKSEITIFEQ